MKDNNRKVLLADGVYRGVGARSMAEGERRSGSVCTSTIRRVKHTRYPNTYKYIDPVIASILTDKS